MKKKKKTKTKIEIFDKKKKRNEEENIYFFILFFTSIWRSPEVGEIFACCSLTFSILNTHLYWLICWHRQAKKEEEYLEYIKFSRKCLIDSNKKKKNQSPSCTFCEVIKFAKKKKKKQKCEYIWFVSQIKLNLALHIFR